MKFFTFKQQQEKCLGLSDGQNHFQLNAALQKAGKPVDEIALLQQGFFRKNNFHNFLKSAGELPGVKEPLDWDVPFRGSEKLIAIGKNYKDHAKEFGSEAPQEPMFFSKLPNTFLAHEKDIQIPYWLTSRFDHEAELAVILGKRGKYITPSQAEDFIAGFTIVNDVTARTLQGIDREQGHPWLRAKSLDYSAPIGPYWVPADWLNNPDACEINCKVNGELRQQALVSDMVHSIARIIAYVSQYMTWQVGDLLSLGTPAGVGNMDPGDIVECSITAIGTLRNHIVREKIFSRLPADLPKEKIYQKLLNKLEQALPSKQNFAQRQQLVVDLLHASLPHYHWTGIYLLEGDYLHLGPYHGKPTDHIKIPIGKGICGRAVAENQSIVVDDVTQESNYLACSLETRAEIVVPIYRDGKMIGEIDIDSDIPAAFDALDKQYLEIIAKRI